MVLNEILWSLQELINGTNCTGDGIAKVEDVFPESVNNYRIHFNETVEIITFINDFLDRVDQSFINRSDDRLTSGLYKQAFCAGVKEVMTDFNFLFLEIEEDILSDTNFSVISLGSQLQPISCVARSMKEAIQEMELKETVGCQVLDVCESYCRCGVPAVESAFRSIYKVCLKPFVMQTNLWLLQAQIYDPFNEYFISAVENEASPYLDDDVCSTNASSVSSLDPLDVTRVTAYKIVLERLPIFLPYSVAQKVLFVGESLILCQQEPNSSTDSTTLKEKILDECGLNPSSIIDRVNSFGILNVDTFDSFINDILLSVNRYVRQLADKFAGVKDQIVLMTDLFLLGRGELFQEFIVRANKFLKRPAHKVKIRRLKSVFDDAFYNVYLTEQSDILESVNFSLHFKEFSPSTATTLDCINLNVRVKWPLQPVFPPNVVANFQLMFRFLLKLRQAHLTISSFWSEMKSTKQKAQWKLTNILNKLNAFIGNLQNYCLIDVIAHEMHVLLEEIDRTDTFTSVQNAVDTFQKSVTEQLFLHFDDDSFLNDDDPSSASNSRPTQIEDTSNTNVQLHRLFADIFTSCQRLGEIAESLHSAQTSEINDVEKTIDSAIQRLFALWESDKNNHNLLKLLFRLDYNDYFKKNRLSNV